MTIRPGKDLVTLVTCTPHGVNTHRLLVHAVRCPYTPEIGEVGVDAYVNERNFPLVAAGGAACGIACVAAVGKWRRSRARRRRIPGGRPA